MNPLQYLIASLLELPDLSFDRSRQYSHIRALIAARNWQLVDYYGICYLVDANDRFLDWGFTPEQAYNNAIGRL